MNNIPREILTEKIGALENAASSPGNTASSPGSTSSFKPPKLAL